VPLQGGVGVVISRRHDFKSPPEVPAEQTENVVPPAFGQAQALLRIVEASASGSALKGAAAFVL
jgi:hypothetical protein